MLPKSYGLLRTATPQHWRQWWWRLCLNMGVLLLLLLPAGCYGRRYDVSGPRILPAIRESNGLGLARNKCLAAWRNWWQPLQYAQPNTCPPAVLRMKNTIYVLYDVNHAEGFNLRRDVYIRMAVFMRQLRQRREFGNVRLVLPPWPRLYHWNTRQLKQSDLPWRHFFDIESMRRHAPIIDYDEFLQEYNYLGMPEAPHVRIDHVYRLMHYDDMFDGNNNFHDKYDVVVNAKCSEGNNNGGQLLRQSALRYTRYNCLNFQGSASLLERLLQQSIKKLNDAADDDAAAAADVKVFAILSAETVLHDNWGDAEFWRARRSMRFAKHLQVIAADFQRTTLRVSNASATLVQRPPMWEQEKLYRGAMGGDYLCAHLRRGDFMQGRQRSTPTLGSAALQIKQRLRELNISAVFVSTDGTPFEIMELKENFYRYRFAHFTPESQEQRDYIKDGGIAIVDQLICANARYFLGTYESTFTYRIYEEREILGFKRHLTFNTLCKMSGGEDCVKNSVWPIVY